MGLQQRKSHRRRRSSVAQDNNPLRDDVTLRKQLMQLDRIKSNRKFEPWKSSFLKRFEEFLDKQGVKNAHGAYEDFGAMMDRTCSLVQKCQDMQVQGVLTNERATVKGRHALNELVNDLVVVWKAMKELIPGTGSEEEKRQYNKFQLGAVLVRDNFSRYEDMKHVNDIIQIFSEETLTEVADRTHLEQFSNYQTQFNRFCDVMADLGLYEVMMACRKFADDDADEDDSLTEEESEYSLFEESIIVIDMKTASIFQAPIHSALEKGIITTREQRQDDISDPSSDLHNIVELIHSNEQRTEIRDKLQNHPTLGIATRLVIRSSVNLEEEHTELEDPEAVSKMWGISLKSTQKKKKKNEEIYFLDPLTGGVGELNRARALTTNFITEEKNRFDQLTLAQAEEDPGEWESLRAKIRKVMGIYMEEEPSESSFARDFRPIVPATV